GDRRNSFNASKDDHCAGGLCFQKSSARAISDTPRHRVTSGKITRNASASAPERLRFTSLVRVRSLIIALLAVPESRVILQSSTVRIRRTVGPALPCILAPVAEVRNGRVALREIVPDASWDAQLRPMSWGTANGLNSKYAGALVLAISVVVLGVGL